MPVHFETDREVIDAALAIIGTRPPEEARVMHIRNTLDLEEVEASEACFAEPPADRRDTPGSRRPLCFDDDGNLPSL